MNKTEIKKAFQEHFPHDEPIVVLAPGRVNLIGEHTDYNDGFVLPMAIDAKILLAGSLRTDNQVHLYSLDYQEKNVFNLDDFSVTKQQPWSNYIRGVCAMFLKTTSLSGMNIVLQGNIPQGGGLSSSAALEVGTALLIRNLHKLNTSPIELIKLAQQAENDFVGVKCGIMDQFISMLGSKDHVLFLDCRSLEYELVPTPFRTHNASIIVVDSGVKRGLVDSEYNIRRNQCEQAVIQLKQHLPHITALRDIGIEHLHLVDDLETDLRKRARHVITENKRVQDAVEHLKSDSIKQFGELMNESHVSLRDDYQVSCRELDLLVELAQSVPGTYGARMTGAGFGGSTVSLVADSGIERFKAKILDIYPKQTKYTPKIYIYQPSQGARQI